MLLLGIMYPWDLSAAAFCLAALPLPAGNQGNSSQNIVDFGLDVKSREQGKKKRLRVCSIK